MAFGSIQQLNRFSYPSDYFIEPFFNLISTFSGDELTVLMQVSKAWHSAILLREQSIARPLINLINFTVTCFEKNERVIESFFIKSLFDHTFKAPLNLPHISHICTQTTIPKIEREINHIIGALVQECKDLPEDEIKEIANGISISKYPSRLKNHFSHCMAMKKYDSTKLSFQRTNNQYDETVSSLLGYLLKLKGLFLWKINFLKQLCYIPQTKAAFHHVAFELAKSGYFNSAFNLAISKNFLDDIDVRLSTLLLKHGRSISQSCALIHKFNNPKLKGQLVLDLLSLDPERVFQSFGNVQEVFDRIAILDETSLLLRAKSCAIIIALLKKSGDTLHSNHLFGIVDGRHVQFYETIAMKLIEEGLPDDAFIVMEMIDTKSANGKRIVAKLLKDIALSYGKTQNFAKAFDVVELIENQVTKRLATNKLRDILAEKFVAELLDDNITV